jgi:pimeloyl-ACP methyl ester carboxylesterase
MRGRSLVSLVMLFLGLAGTAIADDVVDGRFGPGALYRLVRPTQWNGSLVLYAHGFVGAGEEIALPPAGDLLIALLVPQGFAVAFTSFSENGWAVKDGADRTHQLLGIFTSKFGQPSRVYVGGASMGGLITIKLIEDYPGAFAGALPSCAVAGGARRQFDYVGNTRALFDFFYPGVLPGTAGDVPPGLDIMQAIVLPAFAAMQHDPAGAFTLGRIDQTPIPFASPPELVQSIATALAWHAMSFGDVLDRTHGHHYFDNHDTRYTGNVPTAVLEAINAGVERFNATRSALEYLARYYEPSGDLHIPMLMLSTARDPVVPGFHQVAYRAAVSATGDSNLLVQRSVDRYGHCVFTPAELASAFADLVRWVELGIKPTP